ncbi:uncharacterized protein LOC120076208 [Benincasa hispida]|uniref:uncharacterized protein LOC120076208 n=1 Tax=Benincasa hispida TaxID=102211 RepID=UPI001900C509|nr:uncharacterized protein LOC120076208 [Benincasa hispida]
MVHFNVAEMNETVTARNVVMNKINLRVLDESPRTTQEANIANSSKNFHRGSTTKTKFGTSSSSSKKWKKKKGGKENKATPPAVAQKGKKLKVAKGTYFHCNQDEHWKRNCPKYLAERRRRRNKEPLTMFILHYRKLVLDTVRG